MSDILDEAKHQAEYADGILPRQRWKAAADEIERLRKRIEELEQILWVKYDANQKPIKGRYIITEADIDKAWRCFEAIRGHACCRATLKAALYELGIVACSECEGVGVGVSEHCTNCSGHGWVWKEASDE